jgi:hypothetical protein
MLLEKPLLLTRELGLPGPRVLPPRRKAPNLGLFKCLSEASLFEAPAE